MDKQSAVIVGAGLARMAGRSESPASTALREFLLARYSEPVRRRGGSVPPRA